MKHGRWPLALLMLLLFVACNARTTEDLGGQPADSPVDSKDKEVLTLASAPSRNAVEPPSPSSVLYLIFQKDGDGASSYEVENGSWATYWYGYSFDLGGKHYFTGFATQTPDKYGDKEDVAPAPDAKVTIAQATLFTTTPDAEKPWKFQGSDRFVGEFGGYEKANEIDCAREAQSHETSTGKLLLAVPTWYLASGTRMSLYDVFLFNPHELTKTDERRWTYLGNVAAGEDNGAACDEEGAGLPCVKSSGALSFIKSDGDELPVIRVVASGTGIKSGGGVRTLGPEDSIEYRYNATDKKYR